MSIFSIDGVVYNVAVTSLERSFQVLDSDDSGRTTNLEMYRDVLGTFYTYAIELNTKKLNKTDYDAIYEVLSSPVDFHDIILPYGQTTYSFEGYVTNGQDSLINSSDSGNLWDNLSFNVIAKEPKRESE